MTEKEPSIESKAEASSERDVHMANPSIDPVKERRLLWKLDLCICPLVMSIFLVAYLDRSNLGCGPIQFALKLRLIADFELGMPLSLGCP